MLNSLTDQPFASVTCALKESQAAEYIGMSRGYLRQCRCHGKSVSNRRRDGPPYLDLGGSIRYSIVDLDEWLESKLQRSDP